MRPNNGFDALSTRWRGLVFIACVFLLFMQAGFFAGHINHASQWDSSSQTTWLSTSTKWIPFLKNGSPYSIEHPIPKLMADAEEKFKKLLARQSKTLPSAVVEYRKRYGREPPKGFGDWWKFAQENHVRLVDEFDAINEDLAPFWNMSSMEFRRRTAQVSDELFYLRYHDVHVTGGRTSVYRFGSHRGRQSRSFLG
jgi:hypothetical protein